MLARGWVVALVALSITGALTGCIGSDEPTEPTAASGTAPIASMAQRAGVPSLPAELAEIVPFATAANDGTALRGHVYLPKGPGPFATVLIYWPYWNAGGGAPSDGMDTTVSGRATMVEDLGLQALMDAGFALALVNQRGSGISDGCYSYMNHPANGPDANAVIDAIAAEPWSNGAVGMYGISYGGATQYAAIASGPSDHLKAVVPVSGEWDEWNLLGFWGATTSWSAVHPTYRNALQGLGVGGVSSRPFDYQATPQHWCQGTLEAKASYQEYAYTGDKTPFMQERDLREGIRASRVPIFATNGMTDGEGHILQFEGLWDLVQHPDKRLMVGQWPHAYPNEDAVTFTRDHAIPWFDHYLRDGPPVDNGRVDYQDDTGAWHNSTSWPPAESTLVPLHLSDGTLVTDVTDVVASDRTVLANDATTGFPDACPGEEAIFVSEPLAQDVLIAGNFFVNFTISSTEPNENIGAYLWTGDGVPGCDEGGDALNLADHRHAFSDLRHRGHLEFGEDFPLDAPGTMEMRSVPLAEVLPAGSRIILLISAGHPDLYPKPGVPLLTVHTGPELTGTLWLPVIDGGLMFDGAAEGGGEAAVASPTLA